MAFQFLPKVAAKVRNPSCCTWGQPLCISSAGLQTLSYK